MYTILINEKPLIIKRKEASDINTESNLVTPFFGPKRHMFHFIDTFEKDSGRFESITLLTANPEEVLKDLIGLLKLQEAAGGVATNPKGEVLAIFRRGFWDLPKGKIDDGETPPQAAVREVKEETGLQNIVLGDFIAETYHIFRDKKENRIFKKTYWYQMTAPEQALVPQTEEDIDTAVWLPMEELKAKRPLYRNIQDLLKNL